MEESQFGFIASQTRRDINETVIRYWNDCTNGPWNDEKAESMRKLRDISNIVFTRQQKFFRQPQQQQQFERQLAQVHAHINQHLSGIRDAVSMVLTQDPNMTPEALAKQQRARLWLSKLNASIPLKVRPFLQRVVNRIVAEIGQRRDSANSEATGSPVKLCDKSATPASNDNLNAPS